MSLSARCVRGGTHPHTERLLHHERHDVHELLAHVPGAVERRRRRHQALRLSRLHGVLPGQRRVQAPVGVASHTQRVIYSDRKQRNTSRGVNLEIRQGQPVYESHRHDGRTNVL